VGRQRRGRWAGDGGVDALRLELPVDQLPELPDQLGVGQGRWRSHHQAVALDQRIEPVARMLGKQVRDSFGAQHRRPQGMPTRSKALRRKP
jgi:hypothetical protein